MNKKLAIVELFRHREPALLVSGQTVSQFGDGVALVALTLLVLDTTHSASKLAWFAAARMTPLVVLLLVGGVVVDRFSRRTLLLISDTMRALLTGVLVVLIGTGLLRFWELMAFGVLFGTFDAVFMPAITALTPEIVPEDLLPAMNAVRPLSRNLMGNMIGPAVGGVIAATSTTWAIGVDCLTFVASSACLFAMKSTPAPARNEGSTMLTEIREGVRYVRKTRWLWTTLAAATLSNAFIFVPSGVLLPFFLRTTLHTSKVLVGYAFAVFGLSGAIAALIASNLKMPKRRIRVMWTYWLIGTLSALIIGVATNYWEILIFPIISSPMMLWGNVIWESVMQTDVPRELLGRVSSVDWFVSLGLAPLGLVAAGVLASHWGIRTYFVVMSLVSALPGIFILLSRRINEIDRSRLSATPASAPAPMTDLPDANPSSPTMGR